MAYSGKDYLSSYIAVSGEVYLPTLALVEFLGC